MVVIGHDWPVEFPIILVKHLISPLADPKGLLGHTHHLAGPTVFDFIVCQE